MLKIFYLFVALIFIGGNAGAYLLLFNPGMQKYQKNIFSIEQKKIDSRELSKKEKEIANSKEMTSRYQNIESFHQKLILKEKELDKNKIKAFLYSLGKTLKPPKDEESAASLPYREVIRPNPPEQTGMTKEQFDPCTYKTSEFLISTRFTYQQFIDFLTSLLKDEENFFVIRSITLETLPFNDEEVRVNVEFSKQQKGVLRTEIKLDYVYFEKSEK